MASTDNALTASGGLIGAPVEPAYLMGRRPLLDSMPSLCFRHNLGEPVKGAFVSCVRCRRTYMARKRRPPRDGGERCFDCGHTTQRGPKKPKAWAWVEVLR